MNKIKQYKNDKDNEKGFTLIEMSLVLFIISALLLLFIPNISNRQETANGQSTDALEKVLQTQVELYKMDKKSPVTFDAMKTAGYLTDKQTTEASGYFNLSASGVITRKSD